MEHIYKELICLLPTADTTITVELVDIALIIVELELLAKSCKTIYKYTLGTIFNSHRVL